MSFTLALAQPGYPLDGNVLAQVEALAQNASQQGANLLVFPENLMHPHSLSASELYLLAEPVDGPFATAVCRIGQGLGLWVVFTLCETNPSGQAPFNTAVVADDTGTVRATYRKCHLYNAHSVRESDRMTAGDALFQPLRTPFCTLGLGICYDLRFPELARVQALGGADLILFPAAWHDGPNKELHWSTLLRARAIENECFVAGACHGAKHCVGTGHVYDPLGNELAQGTENLVLCEIDPEAARLARDAMPVFSHRRPQLYSTTGQPCQ